MTWKMFSARTGPGSSRVIGLSTAAAVLAVAGIAAYVRVDAASVAGR